jgi:ferredoxin
LPAKRASVIAISLNQIKNDIDNIMKTPVVELSVCIVCGVCVEICPEVFRMNAAGFIEVVELTTYPEPQVDEAIKYCPVNCIYWEEN